MMAASRVKGWCPGALRPMATGDGLLVRVRPSAARLTVEVAEGLAEAARRFGNGHIDLTSRANLQLRGVSEGDLEPLQAVLGDLGILDGDAASEQVRNVLVSPLAGLDPACTDVTALALELEAALVATPELYDLPAKFLFAVDGGGRLLLGAGADIGVVAMGDCYVLTAADRAQADMPLLKSEDAVPAMLDLARRFLAARRGDERRMRQVGHRLGFDGPTSSVERDDALAGPLALTPDSVAFAAAMPFGRLTADMLDALAALAKETGSELRLTSLRAILLAPLPAAAISDVSARLVAAGFVVDPADPLLRIAACPGRPACASGEADVQADARRLAPYLPEGATMHVSGCAKGCARREPATISLTADSGRYGLAFDARAGDPRCVGGLTAADIIAHLARTEMRPPS